MLKERKARTSTPQENNIDNPEDIKVCTTCTLKKCICNNGGICKRFNEIRKQLNAKVGDKIKIVNFADDLLYIGRKGTIKSIDEEMNLHGTWGSLPINPYCDSFVKEKNDDI